jgi:hypothetical protein
MDANQQGRAHAFAVLTPIRGRVGKPWLHFVLGTARLTGLGTRTLLDLQMLYVARFGLVDDLEGEGLPCRYFLFESNFNGSWERYIDMFSSILGGGMNRLWGASPGFPGARPVTPFKRYIHDNELECDHYYVAYPDASARTIIGALELERHFQQLRTEARGKDAEAFLALWKQFLTRNQRHV